MLPVGETILLTLRLAGSIPMRAARELYAQHVAANHPDAESAKRLRQPERREGAP